MTSRVRATALLAVALAALLSLFFLGEVGRGPTPSGDRGPAAAPAEGTLEGGAAAGAEVARPTLEGLPASGEVARGPVLVRVVDPRDAPVAGVRVRLQGAAARTEASEEPVPLALTDALGHVRFVDVPYDGTATIEAWARGPADPLRGAGIELVLGEVREGAGGAADGPAAEAEEGREGVGVGGLLVGEASTVRLIPGGFVPPEDMELGLRLAGVAVRGPDVVLRVEPGLPLRVDVVVADDGRAVPGARWHVTPRVEWSAEGSPAVHVPGEPGASVTVQAVVEPGPGTAGTPLPPWTTVVHPAAERLSAVGPLRPEARILVVFPSEALPFRAEDWKAEVTVAGTTIGAPSLRFTPDGRIEVGGGAHHVGDSVVVGGTLADRWLVFGAAEMGADPREPVVVEARLTATPRAGEAGIDGIFWSAIGPIEFARLWVRQGPTSATGALHVQALLPDGRPAAGAVVAAAGRSRRTDDGGWARFPEMPTGSQVVTVLGAGATGRADVTVEQGRTRVATVRPGRGATVDLEVVDAAGREVPMAALGVTQPSGLPWLDVRDGVQRIDPFTDVHGRRTLEGVEPGRVGLTASYGSRTITEEVVLADGERRTVRLTLPHPFPSVPSPATTSGK